MGGPPDPCLHWMPCPDVLDHVLEKGGLEMLDWRAANKSEKRILVANSWIRVAMKSAAKSLAKAKASAHAPVALPASTSRSILKFYADIPIYASSTLGSCSTGAFVVGGGGGRARTGVKNVCMCWHPRLRIQNVQAKENRCLSSIWRIFGY